MSRRLFAMRSSGVLAAVVSLGLSLSFGCGDARADAQFIQHPDDTSRKVEFFLKKPAGSGPWPAVIFLHGHQEGSRPGGQDFVRWGVLDQFAGRGYLAVAVSQPGYGNSTGPADFCGPLTQHAVSGVIAKLRADGYVSPGRVVIEGISRGALVAGLIAASDPSVAGIVLISGLYDLPRFVADPNSSPTRTSIVNSMREETGGKEDALRARSVLDHAAKIKASALILNGERDERTDPAQARRLAEEITRHGGNARAVIYPGVGHQIPVGVRNRDIDPFIDNIFKK
jgi:dipeptidyl aminopeptidase/acylaminoacyl peptidase